ncbi:MAG TPA: hypothetical protein DCL15_06900 [Chloroflexi bacterium]|nr:hypothetical protein [Chloroflexota bacterium]HHW87784.1 hypothetical protein [Chloroflexota bacterium]
MANHNLLNIGAVLCAVVLGLASNTGPLFLNSGLVLGLHDTSCGMANGFYGCHKVSFRSSVATQGLQLAHLVDSSHVGAAEVLAFAEFERGNYELSAEILRPYWQLGQLRQALWQETSTRFNWIQSYYSELSGNIDQSIGDMKEALAAVDASMDTRQTEAASRRLALLLERSALSPDALASTRQEAIIASACAAQWQSVEGLLVLLPPSAWPNSQDIPLAYHLQAWIDEWTGKTENAEAVRKAAGEIEWNQWSQGDPLLWLGQQLEEHDPVACSTGAMALYEAFSAKYPDSAQGLYLAGLHWIDRQNYFGAQSNFEAGLQREPDNVALMRGLGLIGEMTNAPDVALKWYVQASRLWPENAELHARLGRTYQALGRPVLARQEFDLALSLAPNEPLYWVWLGAFREQYDGLDSAIQAYSKALEIDPDNFYAYEGFNRLTKKVE